MRWSSPETPGSEERGEGGEGGEEEGSQNTSDGHSLEEEEEEEVSEGWDRTVHTHLMALAVSPVETLWAKDSLFRYWSTSSTGQWSPAGTGHLQCVKTVKVIFGGSPVNYVNTKFVRVPKLKI